MVKQQHERQPVSGLLSYLIPSHFFTHILNSILYPISKQQFFGLPPNLKHQSVSVEFSKVAPHGTNTNLIKLFWPAIRLMLLLSTILIGIASIIGMLCPLYIKKIIHFLQEHHFHKDHQSKAHTYILMWIGLYIVRFILHELGERIIFQTGLKVEQHTVDMITKKIARLPSTTLRHTPKAQLLNYVMVEVKLIGYFFKYLSIAISAPVSILIATALILMSGVDYSFIMAIVLILIAFLLFKITQNISKTKHKKLKKQYERLNKATELISQIREVRQLGCQDIIPKGTQKFRLVENLYNFIVYCYISLYDTILNIIPVIVILFVFFKQRFATEDKSISASELYSIFAYSSLITYPLKYLRSFAISTYDLVFAAERLQNFLGYDEIDVCGKVKQELDAGELALSNVVIYQETLKDRHGAAFEERQDIFMDPVKVPLTVQLKNNNHLLILSSNGQGSTLLSGLAGLINISEGRVSVGGLIGYLPAKPWLWKATIKDNICFGQAYDEQKMRTVCQLCQVLEDIKQLPEQFQHNIADIRHFSYAVQKKIALARVLYSQKNILLLDDPFDGLDPDVASRIFKKMTDDFVATTFVISIGNLDIVTNNEDNMSVMLFEKGIAIQFGSLTEIRRKLYSTVYESQLAIPTIEFQRSSKQMRSIPLNGTTHEKSDREVTMQHEQHHSQHGSEHANQHGHHKHHHHGHHQIEGKKRQPRIGTKKYEKLFKAYNPKLFNTLLLIMIVTQVVKTFASWWVSHISHYHGKITLKYERYNIRIFLYTTIVWVILHFVEGLVCAFTYRQNSNSFSESAQQSLAAADMHFYETHDLIVVSFKANKDYEDTFTLSYYAQTVLRNCLLFMLTYLSVTIDTPQFFVIGIIIISSGIFIYINFSRTERQIMRYFVPAYQDSQKYMEEMIEGRDTTVGINHFEKVHEPWMKQMAYLMKIRLNERYIYHALSLLIELVGLFVVAFPALSAINNRKSLNHHMIHAYVTVLAYSNKLLSLMSMILKDTAYVQNIMRLSVKKNIDLMELEPEKRQPMIHQDMFWPSKSEIQFKGVNVKRDDMDKLLLDVRDWSTQPKDRVRLVGRESDGTQAFRALFIPYLQNDTVEGQVILDGVVLNHLSALCRSQEIMYLSPNSLRFTGTLRDNLDPKREHSDRDIIQVLSLFDIPNPLGWKDKSASTMLNQRLNYEHTPQIIVNSLCICRALLRRPSILICDMIYPNKCKEDALSLLSDKLKDTTIISTYSRFCNAIRQIIFKNGIVIDVQQL